MQEDGFGVFYLNNRGYGGSGGGPTEENNVADAIAAYDSLVKRGVSPEQILVYGESLGSGQAIRLAAARPVTAIVAGVAAHLDGRCGSGDLLLAATPSVDRGPIQQRAQHPGGTGAGLVLHGEEDEVIPAEMGQRVYRAANEPKRIELFPHGGHVDLFEHGAWEKTRAFLTSLRPSASH
jgi:uncharacterized protein